MSHATDTTSTMSVHTDQFKTFYVEGQGSTTLRFILLLKASLHQIWDRIDLLD